MQKSFVKLIALAAVALGLLSSPAAFAQGTTTSAVTGTVTAASGSPVAGASVVLVHEPTRSRVEATTRESGRYNFSNLRPGGPYTLTVSAEGQKDHTESSLYLDLGVARTVDVNLSSDVVQLEAFNVTAAAGQATFDPAVKGAGTLVTLQDIENTPSIDFSVQDIVSLDPRISIMDPERGEINVVGQNYRFNSVLVDGVPFNDPFGLNSGGLPALGNPVSLRMIDQFNVQVSPYNVRYSGFQGGLINMVTKSGSNEFSGSAWYFMRNKSMRAPNRVKQSPLFGTKENFERTTWGFAFGGPIIRDTLFFIVGYERFEEDLDVPTPQFIPSSAAVDQIRQVAQGRGGYDTGGLTGSGNLQTNDKYFTKLDWNISRDHRLSATYFKTKDVDPQFPGYTGATSTSLSNYWFKDNVTNESYVAQLFSTWTSDFRTEVRVSSSEYNSKPQNAGSPYPEVVIRGVPNSVTGGSNGNVTIGTERSRQSNLLSVDTLNAVVAGEYFVGAHTLSFGIEGEKNNVFNLFVQDTMGSYTYASLADWVAGGAPLSYSYQYANAGQNPAANFDQTIYGFFVNDNWQINQRLSLEGGIRLDLPKVGSSPVENPLFVTRFGRTNSGTIDGNYTISPRIGFNYDLPTERKAQIRGGIGHFRSKIPAVWLANSFQNTGVQIALNNVPPAAFVPSVSGQPTGTPATTRARVSLTDPNFELPSIYRGNLAFDYALPFADTTFTAEVVHSQVDKGIAYQSLNMVQTGTGPDGRKIFNGLRGGQREVGFEGVYLIKNANDGASTYWSVALNRPMKNNWSYSASYTRGRSTEVSPVTSSVAESNWNNRMIFDPNEETAGTSPYEVTNRIQVTASRRFAWFGPKARTTFTARYEGRTGRPYSWVFFNDINRDGNGDGNTTDNDLFYVPTGPDDTKVTWASPTQRDAFFAFVESTTLQSYKGRVVPRMSERSPWVDRLDLSLRQELPIWGKVKAEFTLNLINALNLINDEWGLVKEVPFSYGRGVASGTYNSVTNTYAYSYNGASVIRNRNTESRWQIQTGIEIKF